MRRQKKPTAKDAIQLIAELGADEMAKLHRELSRALLTRGEVKSGEDARSQRIRYFVSRLIPNSKHSPKRRNDKRDFQILMLHDFQGLSFGQIAKRLGMERAAVQRAYRRAGKWVPEVFTEVLKLISFEDATFDQLAERVPVDKRDLLASFRFMFEELKKEGERLKAVIV